MRLPSAQSSFACSRCYLSHRNVAHLVSRLYPAFITTTNSCANPKSSACLWCFLVHPVFAACYQPLPEVGSSRCYLRKSFPACMNPYPGGFCGALTRFFPQNNGLPGSPTRSALNNTRTSNFCTREISGLQLFDNLQARRFARHPDCSYLIDLRLWAAMAFTSPHISVCYLPEQGIC